MLRGFLVNALRRVSLLLLTSPGRACRTYRVPHPVAPWHTTTVSD